MSQYENWSRDSNDLWSIIIERVKKGMFSDAARKWLIEILRAEFRNPEEVIHALESATPGPSGIETLYTDHILHAFSESRMRDLEQRRREIESEVKNAT